MIHPEIGTILYFVCEHLYSDTEKAFWVKKEYCICTGTVVKYINNDKEIVLLSSDPDGIPSLHYFLMTKQTFDSKLFFSIEGAAHKALKLTEEYDRIWYGMTKEKLRRPWEHYLKNTAKKI